MYIVSKVKRSSWTCLQKETTVSFSTTHLLIQHRCVNAVVVGHFGGKGGLQMDGFTSQTSLRQAFEGLKCGADSAPVHGFMVLPLLQ